MRARRLGGFLRWGSGNQAAGRNLRVIDDVFSPIFDHEFKKNRHPFCTQNNHFFFGKRKPPAR
jgi:hypothetical protein